MFDELVRDALDALPDWVQPYLEDVIIQVADRAPAGMGDLYGLYEGFPSATTRSGTRRRRSTSTGFRSSAISAATTPGSRSRCG